MPFIKFKPLNSKDEELIDATILWRVSVVKDKHGKIVKSYLYFGNLEFAIDAKTTKRLETIIADGTGMIDLTEKENWNKVVNVKQG